MAQMIRDTFFGAGPAAILIKLLLVAVFVWVCAELAKALGKGQAAGLIYVAGGVVGVGMVLQEVFKVLAVLVNPPPIR